MSIWQQHVRDTRARTMGQLSAVYANQVAVYNNQMSKEQIDCAGCGRWAEPSRAEPAYCDECGERVTAEAALAAGAADMTSTDIAAITDYIEQLKAAAIAKGGQIESFTEPPTDPPTTEPPPMSKHKPKKNIITAPKSGATPATYKGKSKSRKQPKPKDEVMPGRPMGERGQGRKPIAPELRLQVFTVRLSIERREKIAALGKEWLERAIDRAKLAEV